MKAGDFVRERKGFNLLKEEGHKNQDWDGNEIQNTLLIPWKLGKERSVHSTDRLVLLYSLTPFQLPILYLATKPQTPLGHQKKKGKKKYF